MKKFLLYILIGFSLVSTANAQFIQRPTQGGTGIGSATIGDIGSCLKVLTASPFVYELGTCGTGGGGSGGGTFSTTTSQTAGVLFNYPNNSTDVVLVGSNSSTTAEVYFDPNTERYKIGTADTASTTIRGILNLPTLSQGGLYIGTLGRVFSGATTTAGTGLTYSGNAFNVNTSQNISTLSNLTTNGFVKTSGGTGALSIDTNSYLTGSGAGVTAVSVASANGFTGSSSGGATPALTLTTSITGLLKGNGTAISAGANGTDYTLITDTTCSGSDKVSAITASGAITCSADQSGSGGSSFTPTSYGASTTTILGFLNGFFSTASSTISITGSAPALTIKSTQTTSQAFGAIELTNNSSSGIGLHITHTDASNSQGGIRLDSPSPEIEFVETDQATPAGKFEIRVNDDTWNVNGRTSADSAFEEIFTIKRLASGGSVGLLDQSPDARLEVVATSTDRQRMFALSPLSGLDGLLFNTWSDGYTSIGWESPSVAKLQLNSNATSPSSIDLTNTIAVGTGTGGSNATSKYLGQFGWLSRDSSFTAPKLVAYIGAESTETYGADIDVGSDMVFYTGTQNDTNPTEKFRIKDTGNLQFSYSSSTIYSSFLTSSSTFAQIGTLTLSTSTSGFLKTNTSGRVWTSGDTFDKPTIHASSTLVYDGAYGASGTTTYNMWNPSRPTTLTAIYCKTDVGTVWYEIGTGSATSTVQCTTSGAESLTNVTFTSRSNVYEAVGREGSNPNRITVTPTFRFND